MSGGRLVRPAVQLERRIVAGRPWPDNARLGCGRAVWWPPAGAPIVAGAKRELMERYRRRV